MKEARIICPKFHSKYVERNTDHSDRTIDTVERELVSRFGGFTRTLGGGGWKNPKTGQVVEELVYVYDIAVEDDPTITKELLAVARIIKRRLDQECVYLRTPDGEVQFV